MKKLNKHLTILATILTLSSSIAIGQGVREIRTINGENNNQSNRSWGSAGTMLLRASPVAYENQRFTPSGAERPNPRDISNTVHIQENLRPNELGASDFMWVWGQFLDHDLTLTEAPNEGETFSIKVPQWDPQFDSFGEDNVFIPMTRSKFEMDGFRVRQQMNDITAYVDASNVYGSDNTRARALRRMDNSGKLKTSAGELLPFNVDGLPNAPDRNNRNLFLAGDVRANEQIGLTAMHTLFVREHNFLCDLVSARHTGLTGEQIFQLARAILIGEIQKITYEEFLPVLIGNIPQYRGYDSSVNPSIANEFSTIAFRLGHTMLSPNFALVNNNGEITSRLALRDAFFQPQLMQQNQIIEQLFRGFSRNLSQKVDVQIIDDVRSFLFGHPGAGGFDLAALNIQRGRDHGLPSYNQIRLAYGLSVKANFQSITGNNLVLNEKLKDTFESVNNLDPWTGMLAEPALPGMMVGETLRTIIWEQFNRIRNGDRLWYTRNLDQEWINWINNQTFSNIIIRNTNINSSEISRNVFMVR